MSYLPRVEIIVWRENLYLQMSFSIYFFINWNLRGWKKKWYFRGSLFYKSIQLHILIFKSYFPLVFFFFLVIIFKHSKLRTESWANDSSKNYIHFFKGSLFPFSHRKSVFRRRVCCLKDWWYVQDGDQSIPTLFQKYVQDPLWTMMLHILFSTTRVF